ncbi:uncharacterized protein JCM6883_006572 [Sporobolomyces salmoneus]|uniref:uncharacterized protein n=1 Tax=Sporobolomyces salmoneus TaxID=183962 RepID=UPI003172C212
MPLETAFDHPLVHDHTLSLEFASASVLRSLDLIFKGIHLDLSFASFAEKFSSLQALRISGLNINFDQSGTGRIVLPELKHLDIFEVDTLLVAFVILDEFSAPKLDRLDIKVNSDHRFISSPDEHAEWLVDLSDTLEKFGLPASSCYLHDPIGAGKIEVEDYLPGIHYDWDIGAFEASYISWCSDPRKEWVSEMEPRGEEEVTEALTTAIDDLADWAKEEARTLTIADDWVGLEELWQQLRDVNELKKYKED